MSSNGLTRVEALKPVEVSEEPIKAVNLEALKLIGISSINLDVNKEPIKAIDLFLFAYFDCCILIIYHDNRQFGFGLSHFGI